MQADTTSVLTSFRRHASFITNLLCLVLMLNLSAPALAAADHRIATQGPGTLLCANGGYRWVSLEDIGLDKSEGSSYIKCVFCFFEYDHEYCAQNTQSYSLSHLAGLSVGFRTRELLPKKTFFSLPPSRAPPVKFSR